MNILMTEKEFHEYKTLQKQLSQLQQENQKLNDSINQSNLAKISALLKLEKLQQEKEELIKWLEYKKMYRKKQILYMEGTEIDCLNDTLLLEYDEILSKLKESDK